MPLDDALGGEDAHGSLRCPRVSRARTLEMTAVDQNHILAGSGFKVAGSDPIDIDELAGAFGPRFVLHRIWPDPATVRPSGKPLNVLENLVLKACDLLSEFGHPRPGMSLR